MYRRYAYQARRQDFVWGVLFKERWTMGLLRNKTCMMEFVSRFLVSNLLNLRMSISAITLKSLESK